MGNGSLKLRDRKIKTKKILILFFFFISNLLVLTSPASAEDFAIISADQMEYLYQSNTYIAKGSVTITFGESTLYADEMLLDSKTYDAVAIGNVTYIDPDADISAERIELNLKTKLGTIYESNVLYKKHNFRLRSGEINKIGEKTFSLDKADVTTCDADPPEWRMSGKDISITQNKSLQGWHGLFKIKEVPVLYTPYFWAPLNNERHSGLLFPSFGYSSARGQYYKQGFYWAIKDNQDATLYLDYYDKKGLGEGLDYRYIFTPGSDGEIWLYHVKDKQPFRSLAEIKSYHNQKFPYDISGYLKLHAVLEPDYYETMDSTSYKRFGLSSWDSTRFGLASEERLQKYLESDMHVSKQYDSGRIYLLAQGRQSLEESSGGIPQSLPEIGFILNTQSIKFFSFNLDFKGVNFWKETGQDGMRYDLYPNLFFSYGRLFNITQKVGIRETAYFLDEPTEYDDRFIYDLDTALTTKLIKKYSSFIHIIEPSLEYTYIPYVEQDEIPFFDSTDSIPKTSKITYALTNRASGIGPNNLETRFRLSQSYSLLNTDDPFTPLLTEVTISDDKLDLSVNASYDIDDSILTELIGSAKLKGKKAFIEVGKSLRRSTDLDQYTVETGIYRPLNLIKMSLPVELRGKLWYDANSGRLQELNVTSSYKKQCWGYSVTYDQRPDSYQIIFAVEFTGLGTFSLGSI